MKNKAEKNLLKENKKLAELIGEQDKVLKSTFSGWRHTLNLWGYYNRVDLIINFLLFLSGILFGMSLWMWFR